MKKTVIYIITLLMTVFVLNLDLKAKKKSSSGTSNKVNYLRVEIDENKVKESFYELAKKLKDEREKGDVPVTQLACMTSGFQYYANNPYIVLETEISGKWWKKVKAILDYIVKEKDAVTLAILNRDAKKYKEAHNNYVKAIDIVLKLLKKPKKASKEEIDYLKEKREKDLEKERRRRKRRKRRK